MGSDHRRKETTVRTVNLTVTSQYMVTLHLPEAKLSDILNAHADWIFEFDWSYETLVFNDDPPAWLYIELSVMAWVIHRWTLGMPIKTFNELRRASKQ